MSVRRTGGGNAQSVASRASSRGGDASKIWGVGVGSRFKAPIVHVARATTLRGSK